MLITMILITSMLAGGAVLVNLQLGSTRTAGLAHAKMSATYCAESGLATARSAITANYPLWNAALAAGTEPAWLAAIPHDLDGDGVADFRITLRDNEDETPLDPARDNDLTVYVVSRCIKYDDAPGEVMELVRFNGGANCYQSQFGGCGGNGNEN